MRVLGTCTIRKYPLPLRKNNGNSVIGYRLAISE